MCLGGPPAETLSEAPAGGSRKIPRTPLTHWFNSLFGSSVDRERGLQQNKLFHGMIFLSPVLHGVVSADASLPTGYGPAGLGSSPLICGTAVWNFWGSCDMVNTHSVGWFIIIFSAEGSTEEASLWNKVKVDPFDAPWNIIRTHQFPWFVISQ